MGVAVSTMRLLVVPLLALVAFAGAEKSYAGYKVFRTEPLTANTSAILRDLQLSVNNLDFWTEARVGLPADINTPPEMLDSVQAWLSERGISFHTMIDDHLPLIEATRPKFLKDYVPSEDSKYAMDWKNYHDVDTINDFIEALAAANDWANIISIGKSYEGRDMKVLAITKAGPGAPNVWLEAGIHAREWISPAVATFLIRELVEDYDEHPNYVNNINWYLLPVANPDGSSYTMTDTRLWRKTRAPNSGSSCKGTDPNRNWDFHWAESGVSHDPCSDVYCGKAAFDQVEMRNIRDFVLGLSPTPVLANCFHSYSQLWLWPYGYAYNAYPDNYKEIHQLAIDASDALYKVHGTVFDPINAADLYPAAGAADDWYKSKDFRYVFTTELRDTGHYGFVLPPEQIIPSGEEMWAGFEVVIDRIQQP